jgi:chromosome segregation ATPase
MTKAQEIYEEIEKRIAAGVDKADAFKALAEETGRPYDSLRGSYYTHKRKLEGGDSGAKPSRTRRRETTPDAALADARASLERSIANIDKEVEAAKTRAQEAAAEYESIRGSAEERKATITERLEALK